MRILVVLTALFWVAGAHAQTANRVTSCGSGSPPTGNSSVYMDANGNLCGVTTPGPLTLVPLDISTVTTGGTAVTALAAGHHNKGGWIHNPSTATIKLCINEQGVASGTSSSGPTTCILPGQTYQLSPNTGAVSVISSDSAHVFSGQGFN